MVSFTLLSKKISADLDVMKNETLYYSKIARDINLDVVQVQQWLTDISATRGLDGLNDGFDMASESADKVLNGLNQFKDYYQQRGDSARTDEIILLEKAFIQYYGQGKIMAQKYVDKGPGSGNKLMGQFDEKAMVLAELINPFVKEQVENLDVLVQNTDSNLNIMFKGSIIALVIFFASLVGILSFTSSIKKRIIELSTYANKLALGDTNIKIENSNKDEIGELFDAFTKMIDGIKEQTIYIYRKLQLEI